MFTHWSFLLAIHILISCLFSVEGLKCFICHMGSCGFNKPVERKIFVVECGEMAISCASFAVETEDPYQIYGRNKEVWFQRICLYPGDLTCIGKDPHDFPSWWPLLEMSFIFFPDWVSCINAYRNENSIPEIAQPPSDSLIRIRDKEISIFFHACKENITDACNFWIEHPQERAPIALAEGFPMDLHEQRKKNYKTGCYRCDTDYKNRNEDNGHKICEYGYKKYKKESTAAYGCTMLAIYKIAGGLKNNHHHFFTRDFWYPGDQWCLERSFNSTPTGRTLGGDGKGNLRYLKRSTPGSYYPCTSDDYSRALKGRDLSNNFEWIGQREFYSPQEFQDFLDCRTHVTNKLKLGDPRLHMRYKADAAKDAWSGKSGVFASVGFRFCGPEDFCNDWTEAELYEKMDNPPPTSTTLKPNISTSTTPEPTKKEVDGCLKKGNEAAMNNVSISYCVIIVAFLQVLIILCPSL